MGKLNIAHHKSYHPYRRDNIERVRRDEEEARLKEAQEEGRMLLADSEARIDLLRERAGLSEKGGQDEKKKKKRRDDDDMKAIASGSSMTPAVLPTTNGHINLFEDLEQNQLALAAAIKSTKKSGTSETEKGVPLAPSEKDLNPWYSGKGKGKESEEGYEEKRRRDESRKNVHDPLTSITKQLARHSSNSLSSSSSRHRPPLPRAPDGPPEVQARLTREMSERERAQALIQRKRKEMAGAATPSTVVDDGYRDVFNRREVEEAHRHREYRQDPRNRRWDADSREYRRRH
ncbi:hypothetical protein CVT24_007679 [Panaeolus cyanescens]|uniref:CBF1-interacting co-repressor CIR N-terminal domain-containing protein n=1 Tax=Panaeolus cyanescens TaxID=181874 RepID=A0A409VRG2_9AGAR|nr:hypothetical protein CVT24_007679 [Panaeolus cyanescens]